MGYYTRYDIRILDAKTPAETDAVLAALEKVSGYVGLTEGAIKWYAHEADCLQVSREFPGITIRLYGEGEEQGDVYVKFFKNGMMEVHKPDAWVPPEVPDRL